MRTSSRRKTHEVAEEAKGTLSLVTPRGEVELEAEATEEATSRLHALMGRAIEARRQLLAAQSKLRDMELEVREAEAADRETVEQKRDAALEEYRNARGEATRARQQLLGVLRLVSERPQSVA